jgi:hypothetical protein
MTHIKFKGTNIDMDLDDSKMAIRKSKLIELDDKSEIMQNLIGKNKSVITKLKYPKK